MAYTRLEKIFKMMEEKDVDLIICTLPDNILSITGHWSITGLAVAVISRDKSVQLLIPSEEKKLVNELEIKEIELFNHGTIKDGPPFLKIRDLLEKYIKKKYHKIGLELNYEIITPCRWSGEIRVLRTILENIIKSSSPNSSIIDIANELKKFNSVKTTNEIDKVIIANEIAAFGIDAFLKGAKSGISGVELSALIEYTIVKNNIGYKGVKTVKAWPCIYVGDETENAYTASFSSNKKISKNNIVMLEMGLVADGFWCDITRTIFIGEENKEFLKLNKLIEKAYFHCEKKIKAGITAGKIDSAARDIISESGYSNNFVHHTGHGVGFKYHEDIPTITPSSDQILEENMVIAVEPGIYIKGFGGVRLENNILISKNGCRRLTNTF